VEFGLINTRQGLRAYGAGILSSAGKLQHSVTSPTPQRAGLDLERVMRTRYKIDICQDTYFVIDSFEQLFDTTAQDFAPLYDRIAGQPEFEAGQPLPGGTRD
jgi:phenylalanine-4-hydroxylase